MIIDIVMPKMGESIMDGRILKWHKKLGDYINRDELLLEISTDKVDTEIPATESGVLVEILFNESETANVGDVIARLETDPSKAQIKEKKEITTTEGQRNTFDQIEEAMVEKVDEGISTEAKEDKASRGYYSPLVLNIASKEGISIEELKLIKGTGIGSRIRKQDLLAYIENKKAKLAKKTEIKEIKVGTPITHTKDKFRIEPQTIPESVVSPDLTKIYDMPAVEVIPMDVIQEKMAEHMVRSVHTSPHVSAIAECDMSTVEKIKKNIGDDFYKKEGYKLTYMPFICECVVKALKDFPLVNASVDGSNILVKKFINLGIAVAMDSGGLIVPVIKNADLKNFVGIARDINDLAKRARIKKLKLNEIQDATFTITNYGIFGNIIGTPIINQPNVGILGTGFIKKRAVVVDTPEGDAIVIKPMMYLTHSFDHRIIDGALGGKFLMKVVEYIENYTL